MAYNKEKYEIAVKLCFIKNIGQFTLWEFTQIFQKNFDTKYIQYKLYLENIRSKLTINIIKENLEIRHAVIPLI